MPKKRPSYEVTSDREAIKALLPQIIAAADQERQSFGFMPARAYGTMALEGKLIAAKHCDDGSLVGYTLLGGTFPQARIFQTYVTPSFRGTGVGQRLVKEVISRCEQLAYLSVRADVADDLEAANRFYRNQGFRTVRRKKGGEKSGRTLVVRVRELATPSLLDVITLEPEVREGPRVHVSTSTETPLYLIDLNVLFDVTKRRVRASAAGRLFGAAADNSIKLAIADEFILELERTTSKDAPDPTLELAKQLPRLPAPPPGTIKQFVAELAPLLFPSRADAKALSPQDRSDISHLATAISGNAKGFVTSEKAILSQANYFSSRYALDVLSPVALGRDYSASVTDTETIRFTVAERELWCRELDPVEHDAVKDLASMQEVPDPIVRLALATGTSASPRRRLTFGSADSLIAFASWDAPRPAIVQRRAYVFVDANDTASDTALDHLLSSIIRDSNAGTPSVIYICPSPSDTLLRLKALAFGFRPRSGSSARIGKLDKICFGAIFTEDNWILRRSALERAVGITLPISPPTYREPSEEMTIITHDRQRMIVSVSDMENLLAPALFATGERLAVIVPIRPDYAEELFSGSLQRSLLHQRQATVLKEKRYFSDRRTFRAIPDNGLIIFYESGSKSGRSAAIAIGRIRHRYLATEESANRLTVESGVLESRSLRRMAAGRHVCVTEFDSLLQFERPVSLEQLKAMGCADAANLVTARAVPPLALKRLLTQAFQT